MLLDFILKKIAYIVLYKFYTYSNIIFSEKYFIEYNFLKFEKFVNFIFKITEFFQKRLSIASVGFIVALIILVLTIFFL